MANQCNGMPSASSPATEPDQQPNKSLSTTDGVAVLVGVVIGIGIFGFPPLVAGHSPSPLIYMALWVGGGLVALVGALCYAELGSSYPHAGGEYHILQRAWGGGVGVLFAWARGTVIQTGSIAAAAFIYGEYAQQLLALGPWGPALHAAMAVLALTALNMAGTHPSKRLQTLFTSVTVLALLSVIAGGLLMADPDSTRIAGSSVTSPGQGKLAGALGMGMVFVLLTYGGWNEAAYLSGELRDPARTVGRVLVIGVLLISAVYVLVNLAYLHIFGLEGLRQTSAVGAELMRIVAGPMGAVLLSLMVCVAALSTINATILTGARVYYALGQDRPQLSVLATWHSRRGTPSRALLLQGAITLILIAFGAWSGEGISTMVAYTAPVFWLFMLLMAVALLILRRRDPHRTRPFRVPWYPFTPLLFAATCLGLLCSSTLYAGPGALLGLLVLAAGTPLLLLRNREQAADRAS